jgi:type I restriction enzyme S subunit
MKQESDRSLVPRLRFPEFRDRWINKKLENCIQLISGLHLSPDKYKSSGEVPYFTGPSDFTNNNLDIAKWTDKTNSCALENDVLITVKGNGVGELWYLKLTVVAMGRQLMAIRSVNCVSQFIFQFLTTQKDKFQALGSGNLIPGLSRRDIAILNDL